VLVATHLILFFSHVFPTICFAFTSAPAIRYPNLEDWKLQDWNLADWKITDWKLTSSVHVVSIPL